MVTMYGSYSRKESRGAHSHEDYQTKGDCKRWIARCLNVGTRFANINYKEVERAFIEAQEDRNVILSFADHDFRDLREDVKEAYEMISTVQKKYPNPCP